jgi:uncharacterized protein YeaO (DUF488 family)
MAEERRIDVRRVYDPPHPDDGYRTLVDRIWPRGLTRTAAAIDEWRRDIAPSTELRHWYGHHPDRFPAFRDRYRSELDDHHHATALSHLHALSSTRLTLLTGHPRSGHQPRPSPGRAPAEGPRPPPTDGDPPAPDGGVYCDAHPIEQMSYHLTMLAYDMNGEPLSFGHGAPLRLRNEVQLGFKQVKWVKGVEFVAHYSEIGGGYGGYNEDHEFFGYRQSI